MKVIHIGEVVTGINRGPLEGEGVFNESPQKFIYGYIPKYYKVIGGVLSPVTLEEKAEIDSLEYFENTRESKIKELKEHLDFLADSGIPKSNSKNQLKIVSRQIKLLRKEVKGNISANELEELDTMESLDNYLDNITDCYDIAETYLRDPLRTLEEIEGYNVEVDPNWPTMGE